MRMPPHCSTMESCTLWATRTRFCGRSRRDEASLFWLYKEKNTKTEIKHPQRTMVHQQAFTNPHHPGTRPICFVSELRPTPVQTADSQYSLPSRRFGQR